MGKSRRRGAGTEQGGSHESNELTWESAKDDPEKLAELTGWKFTKYGDGSYVFYDEENDFRLTFNKNVVNEFDEYPNMLNMAVQIVSELPENDRKVTPGIFIVSSLGSSSVYGQHMIVNNKFTKERLGHNVAISTYAFREDREEISRVIEHELFHAHDYMMAGSKDNGGLSASKEFKKALKLDGPATGYGDSQKYKRNKNGIITGEYSEKSMFTKNSKYLMENYAEAGSIVQMKKRGYGSLEVEMPDGNWITADEWCDTHPNLYKVLSDNIDNFSENNFVKKENVSHPMIDELYAML